MCMAVVSIDTSHPHEWIGLAWPSAGIDSCRLSAGAFCLREHDFSRATVAAPGFIPGRMSRE